MGNSVETIGRYELREELGRGSMGVVHRAHDPVMGRDVAIKTILMPHGLGPDRTAEYHERFRREAHAAGRLSHPGIVTVYDFDRHEDGRPFIAMEFVEGPTLHELICRDGALEPNRAIEVASTLADALRTAHAVGIVHRDLKPANVLVRASDGAAKITDFGVARMSRSDLTRAGATYGSPAYIAPECLRGQRADGRSDLFALGVMFYEMLSGNRPFNGDEFASICHAICNESPRPVGDLGGDLAPAFNTFFARALDKDPERRFQNGAEFAEGLADLRRQQERYVDEGTDADATGILALPGPLNLDRSAAECAIDVAIPEGKPRSGGAPPGRAHGPAAALVNRALGAAVTLIRRLPALAAGIMLGGALLLLATIAGRGNGAVDAADGVTSSKANDPAERIGAVATDAAVPEPVADPWAASPTDGSPSGLPATVELLTPATLAPMEDATTGAGTRREPPKTTPTRPSVNPPRSTPTSRPAERAPARTTAVARTGTAMPTSTAGHTRADGGPSPVADTPEPDAAQTASGAAGSAIAVQTKATVVRDPAPAAAGSVPLTIELRSGAKDGTLVVELDGAAIYKVELAAESRGFRRVMKKAIRLDETVLTETVHVPAGAHSIVVRLMNNVRSTEHSATLEASVEADGPRRLRIIAGRLIGKRLSVSLVD